MSKQSGPVLTESGFDSQTAAQTDKELIALTAGKRIAVYQLYMSAAAAMKITLESSTTTEVFAQHVAIGGGVVLPYTGVPWFITAAGESLTYTTSTAGGIVVAVSAALV